MHRMIWFVILAAPLLAPAANKEHEAIQREINNLAEEFKRWQRSMDDQMLTIKTLMQQAINNSDKSHSAVLVLETRMTERMQSLERGLTTSVTALGAKVDTMADEFRTVKEDVKDINAKMSRLQNQMSDVLTTVKLLKEQPAPPPPVNPAPAPTQPAQAPGPPANIPPAESLFSNARRDQSAGRYEMALSQFQDYLKYYAKSDLACVSQFHVGEIYAKQENYVDALVGFDAVLEKYDSNCSHRADAIYMKGRTLAKAGQPTAGAAEFRRLRTEFPRTEWATKAAAALKELGFSTAPPSSAKKRTR